VTGTMTPLEWADAMAHHYLDDYLRAGGSSVKFVACLAGVDAAEPAAMLAADARSDGYLVAHLDASVTKLHFVEQVFGAIADQMPWDDLTLRVLSGFARDSHWSVPERLSDDGFVAQLEAINGLGEAQISMELQRRLGHDVYANRELAKDFRLAMMWLARARLTAGPESDQTNELVTAWLGARVRKISDLRNYQIFTKVHRANARHLLGSLLVWIRLAGYAGLVDDGCFSGIVTRVMRCARANGIPAIAPT